jgi:cardiolipin synthase
MLLTAVVLAFHATGFLSAIRAVMETRTPQGAIAWVIALITFPYVAVPAYWVFGRSKFEGYKLLRQRLAAQPNALTRQLSQTMHLQHAVAPVADGRHLLARRLAYMPFTSKNEATLLVDGAATFQAIFDALRAAQYYVLVEFYILRADSVGTELQQILIDRAEAGVHVYVLYDALGSSELPGAYIDALRAAGVRIQAFRTWQRRKFSPQINFRNHRKIVVVDGEVAFVGGLNVGDEYLGKDPDPAMRPWRDTHVEDWTWATGEALALRWDPSPPPAGDVRALCLPTGPADPLETGTLFFMEAVYAARRRLWIATPYFVPDEQFVSALTSAALRGVDVRVILPEHNDDPLVHLASYAYLVPMARAGVKMFRYQPGFMHQKVMLIDDWATIGTANFDNRSFRLNFEVTMALEDPAFARAVEAMLLADLDRCRPAPATDLTDRSFSFRLAVRGAHLLAPIL